MRNSMSLAQVGLKDFISFKQQWIGLKFACWASMGGEMPESVGGGAARATCKKSAKLQCTCEKELELFFWYLTFNAHSCAADSMLCGCRYCFEKGMEVQLKAEDLCSLDLNVTAFPAASVSLTEKYVCAAQLEGPPAVKL